MSTVTTTNMRIVTIIGARPQFIKAAAVSRVFRSAPDFEELIIHTGQHYDDNMSDIFFQELEIARPNYNLGIGSGSHGAQTGRMLEAIERLLLDISPDYVLVYGDTNSTLAGALAATKLHLPVAHVEAGLRSFNRAMPEEVNRVLTDHVSELLFAPTRTAVQNLAREGVERDRVHWIGDVMYDAALHYGSKAEEHSKVLEKLGLKKQNYILATVHRAENTDAPARLLVILRALGELAAEFPVVIPIHPRTRKQLSHSGLAAELGKVLLTDPVGYLDMMMLEKNARLIATDSGGVQKEAFFHGVPCVTLRDETEWLELLEMGWNLLAPPTSKELVISALRNSLATKPVVQENPYGDGHSSEHIIDIVRKSIRARRSNAARILPVEDTTVLTQ
jgi:UDP-GlcNAc3NAcA epimerase